MTLQSPFDDFVLNSLAAIGGLLAKLDYVAGLRQDNGAYRHWGLARVHGEDAAHHAAAEAHHLLFSKVLTLPLVRLLEDAAQSHASCGLDVDQYLRYLSQRLPILTPHGSGKGAVLHFSSVLHALSALAHSQTGANQRAS